MKRFIYTVTLLLIGAMIMLPQLYLSYNKSRADYRFSAQGVDLYRFDGKEPQVFVPNGVTLTATQPGVIPSGNTVTYETYLEWFAMMQAMGLNTVKVDALMPGKFYEAFRDYNEGKEMPLYLIQGIYFDEVALKDGYSPLEDKWKKAFQDDIQAAIDAVYGNTNLIDDLYIFKSKPVDVSEYLMGYIVGVNWGDDDISFSNAEFDLPVYEGDYFRSAESANSFEIFLSEMLDYTADYEVTYYGRQSLYSITAHGGNLARSILYGDVVMEVYDTIRSHPIIDGEHILAGEHLKTGFYVNYDVEQLAVVQRDYPDQGENDQIMNGINALKAHHTIPMVISAYGFPTGRFTAEYTKNDPLPYIEEKIQAQRTVAQYEMLRSVGVAGQCLRDWQDAWFKSSWYTYNLKVLDHSVLWRDVQTYGQGYGIVDFDASINGVSFYVDDSVKEWDGVAEATATPNTSYKVIHDPEALHFLIDQDKGIYSSDTFYIGIDVTPNSGSTYVQALDLNFQREVDFVLEMKMDGVQRLLVQDYYDVNAFRLMEDTLKRYPDRGMTQKDSPVFNDIWQYSDPDALYYKFKELDEDDLAYTGGLIYGNNNPDSADYLSVADWYKGEDYIELRLPYGLLNFMSPASKMVFDDFNGHHIFREKAIDGIYLEFVEQEGNTIHYSDPFFYSWDNWTVPDFRVRTKYVYEALKTAMEVR